MPYFLIFEMIRLGKELDKDKKSLLFREISRRLPYHTLAIYNNNNYIGEIVEVSIDEEIITLRRRIKEGNVYERAFIEDMKLILKSIETLPTTLTFSDVKNYDEEHIDFCDLINLNLAIEDLGFYEQNIL